MSRANPRFRRQNPKLPTPLADVYRAKFVGNVEGQLTINTLYYLGPNTIGTATTTTLGAFIAALQLTGGVQQKYLPCMSADWTMTSMIVDVPTTPSLAPETTLIAATGTGPAGHEPTEVGAVMLRTTAFKGQCGRGHITLPAVPTSWVTASRITTTTAYTAFAAAAINNITSGGNTFDPALYSRNGSRAFTGVGAAVLQNFVLNTLLGTVRRRKIGRGK